MKIYQKDLLFCAAFTLLGLGIAAVTHFISPPLVPWVLGTVGAFALLCLAFELYRRLFWEVREERNRDYQQLESMQQLLRLIDIRSPLPRLRAWAISPDFANVMIAEIIRLKPRTIVDVGSGSSTILAAYALERYAPGGTVLSIDHESGYAARTQEQIALHGQTDRVDLRTAPLRKQTFTRGEWNWYDQAMLSSTCEVDLMIVDGPLSRLQPLSRYPAFPAFHDRFSAHAVILVDDGNDPDVKKMTELWVEEDPSFTREYLDCEKGAYLLRRHPKN